MTNAEQVAALQQKVRDVLRKEFTDYFTVMTTPTDKWPAVGHEQFVNALADSLSDLGKQRGLGIAYLQTLAYDLQDRINNPSK